MEKSRTSDKVFNEIKNRIISGEWTPGMKIASESKLAQEFEVSRVSVREAIEKLVAFDVLAKKQGGGTFVNELNSSVYLNSLIPMITLDKLDYIDILQFRMMIEVESTKLCASKCDEEIISRLEECLVQMLDAKDDMDKFTQQDLEFHRIITEGSRNPLALKIYELLRDLLFYHQKSLYKNLGPSGGIKEHRIILDAIKNSDEELAGIFMRRHLERTIKDLQSLD